MRGLTTPTSGPRRLLAGRALTVLLTAAVCSLLWAGPAAARAPNIVVVTSDDQTYAEMGERTMPFTSHFFAEQGTELSNAVVVSPSCCPSRAAFLSGQYSHNNGVFGDDPGYVSLRRKRNTLPVWLHRAGYRTAHVGKFLNHYARVADWTKPAPGYDLWYTLAAPRYYDYRIATPGGIKRFGDRDRDYLTRRLNRKASRFLARATRPGKRRPVYLQLDQFAPHSEISETPGRCPHAAQPDPVDRDLFTDEQLPQLSLPPDQRSYNEEDVSDKSPVLAGMRHLSDYVLSKVARRYRCQLAALRGVDRGFQRIYRALRRNRALRRTVFVYTSDNGFFFAEHRLPNNKGFPYEEGVRVPMLVRLPPSLAPDPPPRLDETVGNIDLTATLVELAGAEPCNRAGRCRRLDGRSLTGLLSGGDPSWPADRHILIQQGRSTYFCAPFSAVWKPSALLVEYPTEEDGKCVPEREYYEMDSDPLQLDNLYPSAPGSQRSVRESALLDRLHALRRCSGIADRDASLRRRPFCE